MYFLKLKIVFGSLNNIFHRRELEDTAQPGDRCILPPQCALAHPQLCSPTDHH